MRAMNPLSPERFFPQLTKIEKKPRRHRYTPLARGSFNTCTTRPKGETAGILWLPSCCCCCSALSGRCGTVIGVRVFAGSPCQMASSQKKKKKKKQKKTFRGVIWLEGLQVS